MPATASPAGRSRSSSPTCPHLRQRWPPRVDGSRPSGCVLPGASNVAEYWQLLTSGRDPKCETPSGRWRADLFCKPGAREAYCTPTSLGGYVTDFEYDWRRHKVPPKQIAQADPLQFMLTKIAQLHRGALVVGESL